MAAVPRILLPSANFWDEATHGVAPRGNIYTTMFPMPSLSGCAFNRSLWQAIGDVAGAEGRAATNLGAANGAFWAPNVSERATCSLFVHVPAVALQVNLVRDPRWGRAQEVPSEAPLVAAEYAVAFLTGFQGGEDTRYRRVIGTCKHFGTWHGASGETIMWHFRRALFCSAGPYDFEGQFGSNPNRFNFDANVSAQDLSDTYLVPFAACVQRGRPGGVSKYTDSALVQHTCICLYNPAVCSYPSINGIPRSGTLRGVVNSS